ncbi:5d25b00d-6466-49a1-afac-4e71fed36199 [Sclerotinia trifoliorum]|uniref:5d25b00d-6466-49a1-afac-4e71fed36199 n=1 Tax=Sclerotinia trifoliorum TaxID=28548 RepID=A0A8H2VLL2_9HELO|nr:5d25b00d-6466-49a1-afac-4e71fed36199 [Sclerotinia trifoliorum]
MTRKDDTKLLIGVFRQWESSGLNNHILGADLGIRTAAAGMRRTRLNERLNANGALTNADLELLIAIINQEKRLPNIDYNLLGRELGINSGAASMRWSRFKARLEATRKHVQITVKKEPVEEKNIEAPAANEPAENSTASPENGNEVIETEQGVFGWPYNEMGWSDDGS